MSTYKKSPLPPNLKSIPKGYVYLGAGDEFKRLPKDRKFLGYNMQADDKFNESPSDGTTAMEWSGCFPDTFYFAPADSEIARLNGLGPRKRKVTPKVRYFVHKDGFDFDTAYVRHDGNPAENVMCVLKDGSEVRSPQNDLEFSLDCCKRGVWKEISEKEALGLVKPAPVAPPAPPEKATIGEVWVAFRAYAAQDGHSLDAIQLCKDGSGIVMNLHDKPIFHFADLREALAEIRARTK